MQSRTIQLFLTVGLAATLGACTAANEGGGTPTTSPTPTATSSPEVSPTPAATSSPEVSPSPEATSSPSTSPKEGGEGDEG